MIGIFGGTFDPIHFGHLRPALDILESLDLEQVRFIPCGQPAHRESPILSGDARLAMVQAAISAEPRFCADDREIMRPGPSYMVDTLQSLKQEFPDKTLCLVLGRDAFLHLPGWHQWKTLFDLAHIVVMTRPQRTAIQTSAVLQQELQARQVASVQALQQQSNGKIYFCEVAQLEISATKIRQMVRQGHNPAYLVPEKVLQLIQDRGLYSKES